MPPLRPGLDHHPHPLRPAVRCSGGDGQGHDASTVCLGTGVFKDKGVACRAGVWQRFLAWDDFLRLGCIAGVYPRRILAGGAANGRRA